MPELRCKKAIFFFRLPHFVVYTVSSSGGVSLYRGGPILYSAFFFLIPSWDTDGSAVLLLFRYSGIIALIGE